MLDESFSLGDKTLRSASGRAGDPVDLAKWAIPGICIITAIWRCRKPLNQWQRSFHLKAALSLVKGFAAASDRSSNTGLCAGIRQHQPHCWSRFYPLCHIYKEHRTGSCQIHRRKGDILRHFPPISCATRERYMPVRNSGHSRRFSSVQSL